MSARFLDDAARAAFARAIESTEAASAIEVVVAMRRSSAGYLHANVLVGAVVAFAALAAMLFASATFGLLAILIDPFVAGLVVAGAVHWLPGVKRVLTPPSVRRRHVLAAARAAFVERGVHNTAGRTGLLVYISWLEQHVAVVSDSGLDRALPAAALARLETELTAAMPRGGAAVAQALQELLAKVAPEVPRHADDRNELPDAIDSDLARPRSAT